MTEDPAPYGSLLYQADPEARWNRLLEAAECHNQSELASFLGLRQSVVSDARRRGSIPSEWLLTLMPKGGSILPGYSPAQARAFCKPYPLRAAACRGAGQGACGPEACSTDALIAEIARRALKQLR